MIRRIDIGLVVDPPGTVILDFDRGGGTLAPLRGPARRRATVTIVEEFASTEEAAAFAREIERRGTMRDYVARCEGSGVVAKARRDRGKRKAGACAYCRRTWPVDDHGRLVPHGIEAEERRSAGAKRRGPKDDGPLEID